MAKKKTIKSELDELNREAAKDALRQEQQEQPVVPVAPTNYTGAQEIVQSPAYQAAYQAASQRIDEAVANSPLFGGQTGAVGESAAMRAKEQGLYPGVEHPVEQSVEQQAAAPVQQVAAAPAEDTQVGAKVRDRAMANGLYGPETGQVGEQAARRAMDTGLFPSAPAQETSARGGYDALVDELSNPYRQRISDLEAEQQQVIDLDAELQRKEDARKRIVALGDAFASFANLIGTAHGAENQEQTYASPLLAETIDKSRAARINRMQQIRKNLDEQRDALINYQILNDPNYYQNRLQQQRIDVQRGNQQLQYDKLANTVQHQGNQDQLARDKFEYQQDKDARTFGLNQQKAQDASARGWANYNLSKERFAYQKEKDASGGGSGGGGGWSKQASGNFNAMKTEIAKRAGFETWEEFAYDPEMRSKNSALIREINEASSSPNKQQGVMSSYAEQYAPDFFEKFYIKEEKQTSSGRTPKPRLYDIPEKKKEEELAGW